MKEPLSKSDELAIVAQEAVSDAYGDGQGGHVRRKVGRPKGSIHAYPVRTQGDRK